MPAPVCPLLPIGSSVLVICEKPSVARDLGAVLGAQGGQTGFLTFPGGFISWAVGHLFELVEPQEYRGDWKEWRMDLLPMVPEGLRFRSKPKPSGLNQLSVLEGLYRRADALVNACDAGREGELIWWEIVRHLGWGASGPVGTVGDKPAYRFWAQSNTAEGLHDAWEQMRPVGDRLGLARSAYSRNEADWLLGLNSTRAVTLAFPPPLVGGKRGVLSVGRVQTPVLALVADRDSEISGFEPRPFFEVRGEFSGDAPFEATVLVPSGMTPFVSDEAAGPGSEPKAFLRQDQAQMVLDRVLAAAPGPWAAEDVSRPASENPPPLFSLTDLQKWCNQAWGWEAKRTLDAAQAAYEKDKTLSYPRTDTSFLPRDSRGKMDQVAAELLDRFLTSGLPDFWVSPSQSPRASYLFDDSKLTDHYAIVPTGLVPSDRDSDPGRVWLAVVRRFFVAFAPAARLVQVRRRLTFGPDVAVAQGKRYEFRGWRDVDDCLASLTGHSPKADPASLPACGAQAPLLSARLHQGRTTPPKHFTEATLLAVMENIHTRLGEEEEDFKEAIAQKGLGTPATRAAILELLISRGYVVRRREKSSVYLYVTDSGRALIDNLRRVSLRHLTEPLMTAQWEQRLLDMERGGSETREDFLAGLLAVVNEVVSTLSGEAARSGISVSRTPTDVLCPVSGQPVLDCGPYFHFPGFPGLRCSKQIAGRPFQAQEFAQVLSGTSPLFDGFQSKKGTSFSAALALDSARTRLEFVFPAAAPAKDTKVVCPLTGEPVRDCGGYWEFPGKPAARFWKAVAKRPMALSEYVTLVERIRVGPLDGFVSSKGSSFSASLVFGGDRVIFDFPPRTPVSPKMTGPGARKSTKGRRS